MLLVRLASASAERMSGLRCRLINRLAARASRMRSGRIVLKVSLMLAPITPPTTLLKRSRPRLFLGSSAKKMRISSVTVGLLVGACIMSGAETVTQAIARARQIGRWVSFVDRLSVSLDFVRGFELALRVLRVPQPQIVTNVKIEEAEATLDLFELRVGQPNGVFSGILR